jgi:hypothetical protein
LELSADKNEGETKTEVVVAETPTVKAALGPATETPTVKAALGPATASPTDAAPSDGVNENSGQESKAPPQVKSTTSTSTSSPKTIFMLTK